MRRIGVLMSTAPAEGQAHLWSGRNGALRRAEVQ
jgi:hypothetical protein